jgi:hypothetical protein
MKKYFLIIIVLALLVTSCKKESGKKENCRITKLVKNDKEIINITYGDNEKISSMYNQFSKELRTYSYSGNKTTIESNYNGNFPRKIIITNNKDQFATNVRIEIPPNEWYNYAYTYDGHHVITNNATNWEGVTGVANFIWENGNLSVLVSGGSVYTYEYYTDKDFQDGDWRAIDQLLAGYRLYEHKNLVKSVLINNNKAIYTYVFDEKGRIKEATQSSPNNPLNYKIEYECN